jgi:hypothetical protein
MLARGGVIAGRIAGVWAGCLSAAFFHYTRARGVKGQLWSPSRIREKKREWVSGKEERGNGRGRSKDDRWGGAEGPTTQDGVAQNRGHAWTSETSTSCSSPCLPPNHIQMLLYRHTKL